MYALKAEPIMFDESALIAKTDAIDRATLWYYRLGHPGCSVTKEAGFEMLEGKCQLCELAKSHRQLFNK